MPRGFFTSDTDCSRNWTRSGWDADLMYILAAHTGNTAGCVNVNKSKVFPNGTLTGGMLDLALGRVDVYGKGKYQEPGLAGLATLYPHKQDDMCVMVPKAAFAPRRLAMPAFSADIWAATGASLGAVAAALRAAHGCSGARLFLEVPTTFSASAGASVTVAEHYN
ncbi:hypothetical protein R5R35_014765 [Gryllus longicercus]|uniref:Uncharacterized protein n=1 Tax=Gryllus longicercus TaxID=2509291 RepID=A0AAN9VPQ4_9ORTH